jgi:PAS domain S-box-containing protein
VEYGGYRLAWVEYPENDEAKTVIPVTRAGSESGNFETLGITWANTGKDTRPTGKALREGVPTLVKDGQLPVLSLPLTAGSVILGALTVHAWEQDAFDEEEVDLMVQLSADLAYGIKSLCTASERRHVEQGLAKSENNLAEAQSIAHLGSWEFDLEKDEEHRSDEFFRILGLPARGNGRASDSVFNYIHPGDQERIRKCLTETLEEGKAYDVEYRIIRPDSAERVVHACGKTLKEASGKISKFIGTIQDITEHKLADEALRRSEARFRSLVEATTDWIWEVDENLAYVYSSPKVSDLLGYAPEEVIGKTPFDLMHPQEAQRIYSIFSAIKDKGQSFSGLENVYIHKNGSLVTIETSGVPVFNDVGKFCGYRGIDRDINERKKTGGEVLAGAEDGGCRSTGRRYRPRFQQYPDCNHRLPALAARKAGRRKIKVFFPTGDKAGREGVKPDSQPSGIQSKAAGKAQTD